ncbi:hypothetical protein [Pseudomonas fluorescens]|uniref:hypothetical protein n=1 Tax=Pseudomonas fluorescens TaxID=294 RepID=UPI00123F062C|nr:hypothetical protein [Pseudomonas fluorescens]VVN33438.1 hypothetical protein PS639_04927 [Pseudomonas fluorescens]
MPAKAYSRSPSPVGARLAGEGVFKIAFAVGARLAGEGVFKIAFAVGARLAGEGVIEIAFAVGARLAGEGVFKIAFAGKPGSYRALRVMPGVVLSLLPPGMRRP